MKHRTLFLCDFEEDYAKHMSAFIKADDIFLWRVHILSKDEELAKGTDADNVSLLLVSEAVYEKWKETLGGSVVIILSESGLCRWPGVEYVDKYAGADEVYRQVMEIYMRRWPAGAERVAQVGNAKCIGFYSPSNSPLQEAVSLTYGQLLAEKGRVLYICVSAFRGFSELQSEESREDLMTLLYYLDNERFLPALQNAGYHVGELHILYANSGHNLAYITGEQWQELLERFRRMGTYEYVILNVTDTVQGLIELLQQCNCVYAPVPPDTMSRNKWQQYERLLLQLSARDVRNKTTFLPLPLFMKIPENISELTKSEVADYVRQMIQRGEA